LAISVDYSARDPTGAFEDAFQTEYRREFEVAGIQYFYTLIDDIVARMTRWARRVRGGARDGAEALLVRSRPW
jgi:hypothetical protein